MKTLVPTLLIAIAFSFNIKMVAASLITILELQKEFVIDENIDQELKNEIIKAIDKTFVDYAEYANFWDYTFETFDDRKYSDFMRLFSGTAVVYNDIASDPNTIHYSTYASLAFKNLQINGIPFEIKNIRINSIEIDDSGYYVADVDFEKVIHVILNKKNKAIEVPKGRKLKLNMRIDMPNYLISDTRIQSIQLQKRKSVFYSLVKFSQKISKNLVSIIPRRKK